MNSPLFAALRWLSSLVLFVLVAPLAAQDAPKPTELRYPIPEKMERATKADAAGMLQWVEWEKPKCPTCKGTGKTVCSFCYRFLDDVKTCIECKRTKEREAVCRVCAGAGTIPDPLEKALCPGCLGAGFQPCLVCGGPGIQKITGGGDKPTACVACRGTGGFKCAVCNGERLVEVAAVKPNLADGKVADLKKAIAAAEQVLAALDTFAPTGNNSRKEVKELESAIAPAAAWFPPFKRMPKAIEAFMGKLYAGNQFVGYQEVQANGMGLWKANGVYYLKLQKRMLELSLKRAEANAATAEGSKGK